LALCYARAHDLLVEHSDRAIRLAEHLLDVRNIGVEDFMLLAAWSAAACA
jgi:hypothetical protein